MKQAAKVVGYAQDRAYSWVTPAVLTLRREQFSLRELAGPCPGPPCVWARLLGEQLTEGDCHAGVIFCEDPGLAACVLNKLPGLRAVAVTTVGQAARATLTLAANVLVVEMPGRTFFEVRQIVRELCLSSLPCPEIVAGTLKELTGHAHR
jgi:hypothetical protein